MYVEFYTSNGIKVQVLEVAVVLHKSALVQAYIFMPDSLSFFKADMTPEEYAQWGNDDNYIKHFICTKMPILGTPADGGEAPAAIPTMSAQQDDNRSVHNEADLNKITSLQDQLTAMETKLKTITDLLFKQGSL